MKRVLAVGVAVATLAVAIAASWPRAASTPVAVHDASTAQQPDVATQRALLATPQARDYIDRKRFAQDIRRFLREASSIALVERGERIRDFNARIDADLAASRMSAGEAFGLQAALIGVDGSDPTSRDAALATLAARYRAAAKRHEAVWEAKLASDPGFAAYKASERDIVREVASLRVIPDGLSRDEYLRRRLMQARVDAYR